MIMEHHFFQNRKQTIIITLALIVIFSVCIFWDVFINAPYYGYVENVEKFLATHKTEYEMRVRKPRFLQSGAFFHIKYGDSTVEVDSNGNVIPDTTPAISFFVYPSVFGETEYMLSIDYEIGNNGYVQNSNIEYKKNDDGTYDITHSFSDPKTIEIFEEYKPIIDDMLRSSEEMWTSGGLEDVKHGLEARDGVIHRGTL